MASPNIANSGTQNSNRY